MDRHEMWEYEQRLRALSPGEKDLAAAAAATEAMTKLTAAISAGDAQDIAGHPDLAELNVQVEARYEPREHTVTPRQLRRRRPGLPVHRRPRPAWHSCAG